MARKKRVAWRKLNPRVHWKHQNWTCDGATLQENSSNTPSGISELQEFLQRPLHLQTLPSCCSIESPAARRLLSHFITRKPDRAMASRGCWRTHALPLNQGPFRHLSAWDHGSAKPRDLHRKTLHAGSSFLQYGYSYDYCSILGVLHSNKAPHCWTLTRNSTCYPRCVDILSQEDWDFIERYSYRQR